MTGTGAVERQQNHVIFDADGIRVSVAQSMRVDRCATKPGIIAVVSLRPTSVRIEGVGEAPQVVELEPLTEWPRQKGARDR